MNETFSGDYTKSAKLKQLDDGVARRGSAAGSRCNAAMQAGELDDGPNTLVLPARRTGWKPFVVPETRP